MKQHRYSSCNRFVIKTRRKKKERGKRKISGERNRTSSFFSWTVQEDEYGSMFLQEIFLLMQELSIVFNTGVTNFCVVSKQTT
ncbi:hypothetical protein CTI12_AA428640 [Artemisia annua]|uniref:Uncharacterized protein n=1 Tax=Artemisia annua TaxID=35608 RepID=A0A2U1M1S5_ARTAN|nr:hypothetical protein CTI12_AA428640 [Artemisia annua]